MEIDETDELDGVEALLRETFGNRPTIFEAESDEEDEDEETDDSSQAGTDENAFEDPFLLDDFDWEMFGASLEGTGVSQLGAEFEAEFSGIGMC